VYNITIHYTIGKTVNIDRFTAEDLESDVGAGVLRLINGRDSKGPVHAVQYKAAWRIIIRPEVEDANNIE
jgi:hypothetical protein